MSLTFRILMFVLALSSAGCHLAINALKKHNEEVRAEKWHQAIQTACNDRDLEELKKYRGTADKENNQLAQRCYTEIKFETLIALDCDGFVEAFEWVEKKEGNRTQSSRNDLLDFSMEGFDRDEEREAKTQTFVEKALECKATRVLFGSHKHVITSDRGEWLKLLEQLDDKELYAMLRADIGEKKGVVESSGDLSLIIGWLTKTQTAVRCSDLNAATRGDHPWRGTLLPFYTQKKCSAETRAVAGELLASKWPEYRMDACSALKEAGDRTHLGKMKRLAQTDPARSIEKERSGYWVYAFVTHPVREVCQQAINELEMKGG